MKNLTRVQTVELKNVIREVLTKFGKKGEFGEFTKFGNMTIKLFDDIESDDIDVSPKDKSNFLKASKKFGLAKLGIKLGTKILSIEKTPIKSLKKVITELEVVSANPNARTKVIEVIRDETGRRTWMSIEDVVYLKDNPPTYSDLCIERGTHEWSEDGVLVEIEEEDEWTVKEEE